MEKFLKLTLSDEPTLIKISQVMGVKIKGLSVNIQILLSPVGHTATGASEVLGYEIGATTASDATKQKEQLTAFVNEMERALSTNWQNPIFDITSRLPYPVTAITKIETEWSA